MNQANSLVKQKIFQNFTNREKKLLNFIMLQKAAHDSKNGKGLKISTPKQMLQRFPISLAQVKIGNTSKKLLKEIR